ncbi:hypothetical protein HPB50_000997 [Hyalomma asiaticum]|uniref:Uncharacterized protein n=1 Tax=Hyalomma asiaticum TaxID=266040 RepID=A0ACB7SM03_HYAAI|nr:hypothetical protein HPB50_000997 [Hyalomma asiaticum]
MMCLSPNNIWRLAGVLSYQRYCGMYQKHPSVFSNIYEMRDFIHNVTGLLSYNVTHDPQLYTLLESLQADDGNVSAAVRSHAAGKMAGLEHNASAVAAALYSHDNILGEHGENASVTTTPATTTAGHDVMFLDLEGFIPKANHTKDSILDEGNLTAPMTTTTMETPTSHSGAGVEARLQEVDHAGVHTTTTATMVATTTTTANATDGYHDVATTTVDPRESMASLRLMDVDSGEVSPSSETSRDASSSSAQHAHRHQDHESQHQAAPTNDSRTESRGRSAVLLANRIVADEMQAFIERNSAEETTTTEQVLVENGTSIAGTTMAATTEVSGGVFHATTHWENASSAETTTMPAVTSHRHNSHASLTIHDNRYNNYSTCLGFACNSGEMCIDQSGVCDGIYDCLDASDEVNCVQLKDAVVHGRKEGFGWMPACGDTWNDVLSDSACREMGFEKASETSIIALESPYAMSLRHSNKSHEQASILQSLTLSNETCNTKVTMKCHHYLHAGSWTFQFLRSHGASSAPHHSTGGILINHRMNMTQQTDVALVRLNHTVEVSDHARPICLPEKKVEPKNCVIAGLVLSVGAYARGRPDVHRPSQPMGAACLDPAVVDPEAMLAPRCCQFHGGCDVRFSKEQQRPTLHALGPGRRRSWPGSELMIIMIGERTV